MRPGEALGLKWEDFQDDCLWIRRSLHRPSNGDVWFLHESKTDHSPRNLPLPAIVVEELIRLRRRQAKDRLRAGASWPDHGLIFVDENGEPLRWQHVVRTVFPDILAEASLPKIRGYDLRHTCATLLLAAGLNPKVVSERLGHSTVALMLDMYAFALPGLQEPAPCEPAQDAELQCTGQGFRVSSVEAGGLVKADRVLAIDGGHTVDSEHVGVVVRGVTSRGDEVKGSGVGKKKTVTEYKRVDNGMRDP